MAPCLSIWIGDTMQTGPGRPRSLVQPVIVRVALYLRPGEDDDLIRFFQPIPVRLRASAVKQALRSGKLQVNLDDLPSDDDIEAQLDSLLG
jgi:hypothetical protein